jgi:hypothetical protein
MAAPGRRGIARVCSVAEVEARINYVDRVINYVDVRINYVDL